MAHVSSPGRRPLIKVAEAKREGSPARAGRFLRLPDVIATTGLSRPTIYRLIAKRDFPEQHQLTRRSVGWWESDIENWLRNRTHADAHPS
ncbi:helix-turn-helix transcriptional regulator [Sphingomonas dokdonensis]|uniref:Prophage CP4-57 regulatory protein (AlpA) n=1 Tax=Sphingomonas dokdonensis TaxID=344880 RepID=A0A245ZCX0_9SPHN|nr:AlpA family phage regulatory protein [Sphingomonas dokdonensis]OWK27544.1 prophage CP4-57 regulatory protein (AlpA) [Sphingomonas dokdonensis]